MRAACLAGMKKGDERDYRLDKTGLAERQRIARTHVAKHVAHQRRKHRRGDGANDDSAGRQTEPARSVVFRQLPLRSTTRPRGFIGDVAHRIRFIANSKSELRQSLKAIRE
jgi:hypothetical protein